MIFFQIRFRGKDRQRAEHLLVALDRPVAGLPGSVIAEPGRFMDADGIRKAVALAKSL